MNVLLINLTRFGDLLQMQPLILGLKAQGHTVGLLCLENFAPATALIRGLSYVAPLPGGELLRGLAQGWHTSLTQVETLCTHIETHFPVAMVINTTATLSARLLARRIVQGASASQNRTEEIPILGFGVDDHGFGVSGDMWATFLQGASAERLNCPFNLVDMFRSVAQVADILPTYGLQSPSESVQQAAHALLQKEKDPRCQGFVAFQLGASDPRRQWPIEHFVAVGAQLWQEKKLCPLLLGSPAEINLGEQYAQHCATEIPDAKHPFINVIGKTDIPHLAAVLLESKLLITNDTGTMHLAAGFSLPIVSIFLATAQAWDTGPYMPDACCLEPAMACHPCAFHKPCVHKQGAHDMQPCLQSISAQTVYAITEHYLTHGCWPTLVQKEARVWKTSTDHTGFATLQNISGHDCEERSHWLLIQRHFYRQILDDIPNTQPLSPEHVTYLSEELRQNVVQSLGQCTQLLLLLHEHMQLLQRMPSKDSGKRILNICNTIYGVLEKCSYLKAFSYLWLVLFQEKGAHWESFASLVQTLRAHLLTWHAYLDTKA